MTEASHIICSAIFLHILLPSFSLCTSTKVISSISSYHQLFNWSITPAPLLLNASLINYCPPQVLKWEGCQAEFSRLRWISIVFVPSSVRAHQPVLKHTEEIKSVGPKQMFIQGYIWQTLWQRGFAWYLLYFVFVTVGSFQLHQIFLNGNKNEIFNT